MELPPDDPGWVLDGAPPLPEQDEGHELPGLPDQILGDGEDIMVEDSSDHALIPVLLADDVVGMDICEVCDAVALPGNLARPTCACQQKCVERVMEVAEPTVRHLRDEVRDKSFLLELVNTRPLGQGAQPRVEDCRTQCLR